MKTKFIFLILGILVSSRSVCNKSAVWNYMTSYILCICICLQHLMISGDAADRTVPTENIEAQLEKEIGSLKNESAEGSFNDPTSEPCKQTTVLY